MTHPSPPFAQRLRGLADQLDAAEGRPSQTLLRTLFSPQGLLRLTAEAAAAVRVDLDAWDQALSPEEGSEHLHEIGREATRIEERLLDSVKEAQLHLLTATRLMARHAGPAEAAAAALSAEQSLWEGPEIRGNERVHLWQVEGSDRAPLPGLAPTRRGYADSYGYALFTRRDAEQVVADMLADGVGFGAAFQPDGSLVYTWPKEYDGDGGRIHVIPDDRGLYAIGGQWPWKYSRPSGAALAHRSQAARIASSTPGPATPSEATTRPTAPATTLGRTR
ncbi:hypothetical protein ACFVVA_13005 [Kitasatospora sp. NPDC058048]|uniref:hypothetical protein n=1 Tax=Kitasatospora sp. NPDC058048 TaxID=3346313 RepID=UPI0036DC8617